MVFLIAASINPTPLLKSCPGPYGFDIYEGYNREMIRLFEERGYQLIWGGTELYEKALEQEEQLNEYPAEGYIREYDDYIVVKF